MYGRSQTKDYPKVFAETPIPSHVQIASRPLSFFTSKQQPPSAQIANVSTALIGVGSEDPQAAQRSDLDRNLLKSTALGGKVMLGCTIVVDVRLERTSI